MGAQSKNTPLESSSAHSCFLVANTYIRRLREYCSKSQYRHTHNTHLENATRSLWAHRDPIPVQKIQNKTLRKKTEAKAAITHWQNWMSRSRPSASSLPEWISNLHAAAWLQAQKPIRSRGNPSKRRRRAYWFTARTRSLCILSKYFGVRSRAKWTKLAGCLHAWVACVAENVITWTNTRDACWANFAVSIWQWRIYFTQRWNMTHSQYLCVNIYSSFN